MQTMTGTAKQRINGEPSYICPLCGNGSGSSGDGLTRNPKSKDGNGLKCFKCGFSGDIIDLYQQTNGTDHNETLSLLADMTGVIIDHTAQRAAESHENTRQGTIAPAAAEKPTEATREPQADYTEYYKACKARINDPAAVAYLESRCISVETAKKYWIGYDPAADPANAPGAIGDEYKPHPCPRIISPTSESHYVGRRIDGGKEFAKVNSKGGHPGIFNAAALYAPDVREVFITEGIFDALSVIEAGAPAIAINSTSNAPALLKRMEAKRTAATLVLCLDNDEAGQRAAQELREGLQRLEVKYITADICCGYNDPNDALRANRAAFNTAVRAAQREARKDYLTAFLDTIQTEAYKPYQTGLKFFDDLLCGGVIRQTLLLLLAAPGTGKTTLAQQIGEQMAAHGKPVVYLNLEMSREQMTAKAISGRLARKGHKMTALQVMQGYQWTDEQRAAVVDVVDEYREKIAPHIAYNPDGIGSDLEKIKAYLQRIGAKAKSDGKQAPVVILDYLHLVSSGAGLDVKELIKQTVTALKEYAIDYNTFVIGIVATNRDSNRDGRITMESGRDSSNLEYTADYQLSLNYYDIDNGTVKPSDVEEISRLQQQKWRQMIIRVLKGRFVTPGRTARVYFNAANNLFYGEGEFVPLDDDDFTPFDAPLDIKNLTVPQALQKR